MIRRTALVLALALLATALAASAVMGSGSTKVSGDITMSINRPGKILTEGAFTWSIDEVQQSAPFDLDALNGTVWSDVSLVAHVNVKLDNSTLRGRYWGYSDVTVGDPAITCQGSFSGRVDFLGVTEGPWRITCSDGSDLKAYITTSNVADPNPAWELSGRITP